MCLLIWNKALKQWQQVSRFPSYKHQTECGSLKTSSLNWNYGCVSGKQLWTEIALIEQNTWQHLFLSYILPLSSNEKPEVRKIRWHQITTDVGQHQCKLDTNVTLKNNSAGVQSLDVSWI